MSNYNSFNKEGRKSNLIIALRGARKICGRDLETGILIDKNLNILMDIDNFEETALEGRYYSNLLLGLTNYLIILDLIGSIFKIKLPKKSVSKDGIKNVLSNFTDIDSNKTKGIEGLRNSLTHNFGLANDSFIFQLSSKFDELITLPNPAIPYQLQGGKREKSYTKVNEIKVCQLVEDIFKCVIKNFEENNLEFTNGMSLEKLYTKFTII